MKQFSLREIAERVDGRIVNGEGEISISSVVDNGNHSESESIYVAIKGSVSDGHQYIDQAFGSGAVAAVVQDERTLGNRPGIVVDNSRKALSTIAAEIAGNPGQRLVTAGVTGTNGKTTVHYLLFHLLQLLGESAVRMGTTGTEGPEGWFEPGVLTTPSTLNVQRTLKRAEELGAKYAVVETSSHALDQYRVGDVYYDLGIFTNLSEDHLDYHPDMDHYLKSKITLFELVAENPFRNPAVGGAVVEIDNPYGEAVLQSIAQFELPALTYGWNSKSDVQITSFEQSMHGSELTLQFKEKCYSIRSGFFGKYNAQNLAAVFASGVLLGFTADQVASQMESLPPVPGRLEPVGNERLAIFVDYAHTPDALENALHALRDVSSGQLWVVFGCGGDRDPGRRFGMGKAATAFADKVVVTSDNPRTENPDKIITDILSTVPEPAFIEADRRAAIEKTLTAAGDGDIVLIAGKGHEDYQIIGTERIHFSDQEEVGKLLQQGKF